MIQGEQFHKDVNKMFKRLRGMFITDSISSFSTQLLNKKDLIERSFKNVIIRAYKSLDPTICIICDPVILAWTSPSLQNRTGLIETFVINRVLFHPSKNLYTPREEINLNNGMAIDVTDEDGMWWEFLRMRLDLLNDSIDAGEIKMKELIETAKADRINNRDRELKQANDVMEQTKPYELATHL